MTVSRNTIKEIKDAISNALSNEAGNLLRDRLMNRFDDVLEGKLDLEDSIKRTKIAIRIFIDKKLAETLEKELRQLAGLGN